MNCILYLIRIEIGVFKNFKECARSPCNGNHFSSIYVVYDTIFLLYTLRVFLFSRLPINIKTCDIIQVQ